MRKFLYTLIAVLAVSCQKSHQKDDYLPLIIELHSIECEKLKSEGITFVINDTNIYAFRSLAFDKILTSNPDARLIAYWEDINQKLASIEYWMDDDEKLQFREDFKQVYLNQCK